jgi:hypothetical protein
MWLLTNFGFFSVVQKPEDVSEGTVTVRARVQGDLETLRQKYLPQLGQIAKNAGSDYQYRARVSRSDFAIALLHIALDIDYSNFKDSVGKHQGSGRSHVYRRCRQNARRLLAR